MVKQDAMSLGKSAPAAFQPSSGTSPEPVLGLINRISIGFGFRPRDVLRPRFLGLQLRSPRPVIGLHNPGLPLQSCATSLGDWYENPWPPPHALVLPKFAATSSPQVDDGDHEFLTFAQQKAQQKPPSKAQQNPTPTIIINTPQLTPFPISNLLYEPINNNLGPKAHFKDRWKTLQSRPHGFGASRSTKRERFKRKYVSGYFSPTRMDRVEEVDGEINVAGN